MTLDHYSDVSRKLGYVTCECGRERTKEAIACPRCTYLDGSREWAHVIDVLRGTDGLSVREICLANKTRHQAGVLRSLKRLMRLGRVRRYWRDGDPMVVERRIFGNYKREINVGASGCWVYALDGKTEREWER